MSAGLNIRARIWRINYQGDNAGGGAVTSGTVLHSDVLASLQEQDAQQLIMQQGLETRKTFLAMVVPGTIDIKERDEFEVTFPFNHHYFGARFRIIGVRYSSHNPYDPRNYILLDMTRDVVAHADQ